MSPPTLPAAPAIFPIALTKSSALSIIPLIPPEIAPIASPTGARAPANRDKKSLEPFHSFLNTSRPLLMMYLRATTITLKASPRASMTGVIVPLIKFAAVPRAFLPSSSALVNPLTRKSATFFAAPHTSSMTLTSVLMTPMSTCTVVFTRLNCRTT